MVSNKLEIGMKQDELWANAHFWYPGFSKRIEVGGALSAGGTNRAPQVQAQGDAFWAYFAIEFSYNIWYSERHFLCKIYYNVVSVAAGEKQGYTKQFSR